MSQRLDILIVDDEEIVRLTVGDYLSDLGHSVASADDGKAGLAMLTKTQFDIVLVDVRMPRMDGLTLVDKARDRCPETAFVVITGHADMDTAIEALRLGAADFLVKPIRLEELDAVLAKALRLRNLRRESQHLRDAIRGIQHGMSQGGGWQFVGVSAAAQRVRQQITEAAHGQCDAILITGETGTGKEVAAHALHLAAADEAAPFIAVNCPALPANLMESELFGHTKGAFTGAAGDRAGAFELADGGTLFLDEIGDLAPAIQAALLRVLETRAFRRVGGTREINVSVRVIAATNLAMDEALARGTLRRDLYYRISAYHILLPPLRERKEDILPLARHFLEQFSNAPDCACKEFTPAAQEKLARHDFPGNARELRNVIERAWIVCRSRDNRGLVDIHHLDHLPVGNARPGATDAAPPMDDEPTRLRKALDACKWNRRQAARELGMPYSTLRYKIKCYGIDAPDGTR